MADVAIKMIDNDQVDLRLDQNPFHSNEKRQQPPLVKDFTTMMSRYHMPTELTASRIQHTYMHTCIHRDIGKSVHNGPVEPITTQRACK